MVSPSLVKQMSFVRKGSIETGDLPYVSPHYINELPGLILEYTSGFFEPVGLKTTIFMQHATFWGNYLLMNIEYF